jgi:hypothetical protein
LATAHVTDTHHSRPGRDQVVVDSTLRTQAPAQDALSNQLVGDLQQDHRVQVIALQEKAGLGLVAGEAVDDEAEVPVVLAQAPMDHRGDQVVRDQLAGGHAAPDLGAQLGAVLDVPAEDVTDTDVLQIEGLGQQLGLGPLPAALDTHDDVLAHPVTCLHVSEMKPSSSIGRLVCLSRRSESTLLDFDALPITATAIGPIGTMAAPPGQRWPGQQFAQRLVPQPFRAGGTEEGLVRMVPLYVKP